MKRWMLVLAFVTSMAAQSQNRMLVYFDFDSACLNKQAISLLDSFCRVQAAAGRGNRFSFTGHTDGRGGRKYNEELAQERAQSVVTFMLEFGLNKEMIGETTGKGEQQPVAGNDSEAGRALNRRVEIQWESTLSKTDLAASLSISRQLADTSARIGSTVVLHQLNFIGGRHQVLPESIPALDELLAALRANQRLEISIEGHICCHDGENDGLDNETGIFNLSEARAKAIYEYLLEQGIEKSRLRYQGLAHRFPIHPYPEQTEEERTANRRVEIRILRK